MKIFLSLFLIITIAIARDSYDLERLKNASINTANNNLTFYYLNGSSHLKTDFDLLAILLSKEVVNVLENPNITNQKDKEFLILTEIFYYLLENTELINNKDTGIGLIIDNKMYAYDKLLVISKDELDNLRGRLFNNSELTKAKNFSQVPPFYPMKNVLSKAKIFSAKKRGSGYDYTYDKELSNNYKKFIKKYNFRKHILENYIEDAYYDYEDIKKKIHGYASIGYIDEVKRYIKYKLDLNIKDDENNQTPLDYAVANGYYDIVKLLVDNGADVNYFQEGYESPYFASKRRGFDKITKFLKPLTKVTTNPNLISLDYSSDDLKNMCFGASSKNNSFCSNINNLDMKNSCFAITKSSSYAFNIQNKDFKNLAFGKSKDNSYCFNIKNKDLKNACFGISKDSSYCYSIKDENIKSMCFGIAKESSYCYDIH